MLSKEAAGAVDADADADAVSVCVCVEVKGQGEGQTLAFFLELVSTLLCCAYASYFTENKGLLTEQALLLSKESLFRQQASGPSCANALVLCLLLDTTMIECLA